MPAKKASVYQVTRVLAGLAIGLVFTGTASALAQDVMQPPPDIHPVEPIKLPDTPAPATAAQPPAQAAQSPASATATPQTSQH
jgi:hypothetical protein